MTVQQVEDGLIVRGSPFVIEPVVCLVGIHLRIYFIRSSFVVCARHVPSAIIQIIDNKIVLIFGYFLI